jgi:uncharacterized protein DUF4349
MNRHELTVEELTAELHSLREAPSEEFASTLDARAAAGFPGRRRIGAHLERLPGGSTASRLATRFRGAGPRQKLLPALAGATTVIVVATVAIVATDRSGDLGDAGKPVPMSAESGGANAAPSGTAKQAPGPQRKLVPPNVPPTAATPEIGVIAPAPTLPPANTAKAPGVRNRQVQRFAELTLGTDPEQVQQVAGKVFDAVGRYQGIVLSSSVHDGSEGEAGASFELLIPSRRLSDALSDLSGIAEVRSRSENTLDITAPTVSAHEHLRDARAEAEGLLRQLAEAGTDTERASIKAQLHVVRGRIAAFRSQLRRLEQRADFSRVSLRVATGSQEAAFPTPGDGDWTIGDALHDAGRVLAVAAGVALIALAVTLPLALLGGGAWAGRRIYLRRAREQALGT